MVTQVIDDDSAKIEDSVIKDITGIYLNLSIDVYWQKGDMVV